MKTLPKPQLRGHLSRYIGRSILETFLFCGVTCSCFYYFYIHRRKKAYAEYHRTFDSLEHCNFMEKYGYLTPIKGSK